jgi:hypothetical protein
MSCPGAIPQEVTIGDEVLVCTKKDRVKVKEEPAPGDEREIFRVYPGTSLTIVDGPICAYNSYWWKVLVPANTKASEGQTDLDDFFPTEQYFIGWIREGEIDDKHKDFRYICKK